MSATNKRVQGIDGSTIALLVTVVAAFVLLGSLWGSVALGSQLEGVNEGRTADPFEVFFGVLRGTVLWPAAATWILAAIRERTLAGRSVEEYVDLEATRALKQQPDRTESLLRMIDGYARVRVLRESISLIAPGQIRAAAEDLAQKLDELDGANAPQARDAVREARKVLVTAARGYLGVLE